jgi:hypothetical protein
MIKKLLNMVLGVEKPKTMTAKPECNHLFRTPVCHMEQCCNCGILIP